MVLGFKQQFVSRILEETKIHTIREDSKDRWKKGNEIHFATGVRTKDYLQFHHGFCQSTQRLEIKHNVGHVEILIDGETHYEVYHHGLNDIYEYTSDLIEFVNNDGFDTVEDFFKWFKEDFSGKIIHWTELTY